MDISIPELLYEEGSFGVFLLVTVAMGGAAAWMSGRAIAATWRPWWHIVVYALLLGLGVRFIHFALFGGTLLSPYYYLVDSAVCLTFAFLGFRITRAGQMARQYGFRTVRTGLMTWARRSAAIAGPDADSR
jgi:NO-binding membrane sensor protein with MHYT domain